MSASKDKILRKQQIEAGTDKRSVAEAKERARQRKSAITYTVVAVALVVFFAFIFIFNSALPSRALTAVTINGVDYSVAQLNYYYSSNYMSFCSAYGSYINYGMFFDPQTSLADQEYAEGQTWRDFFLESAVNNMTQVQMLCDQAEANGFTLPEEDQAEYEEEIASLETSWEGLGYSNLKQFINMSYGKGVDMDMIRTELYRTYVASAYSRSVYDGYEYTPEQLDERYASHEGELDMIRFVSYTVAADSGLDAEAMAAELNGANEAAFTQYLADNADGAEPNTQNLTVSSLNATYADWLKDSARQAGDTTSVADGDSTYVVMFLSRDDNSYPMANFRHILIEAEDTDGDGEFSQEEKDAAAEEAAGVYTLWQNGDATEDSFAAMVADHSDDAGSSATGGLYENVAKNEMVAPINDWLFEDGRKAGDTTVVSYEGDSYTGTHVVYYVGPSELTYAQYQMDSEMRNEDYQTWQDGVMSGYVASTAHLGMAGKNH